MFEQLVTNFFLLSDIKQIFYFSVLIIGLSCINGGIQAIIEHFVHNRGLAMALFAVLIGLSALLYAMYRLSA